MRRHPTPNGKLLPGGLVIVHEDRDIIVVDKPPGLLTISTEREKSRTAYFILTDYVRKELRNLGIVFSSCIGSIGRLRGYSSSETFRCQSCLTLLTQFVSVPHLQPIDKSALVEPADQACVKDSTGSSVQGSITQKSSNRSRTSPAVAMFGESN
jgi:hypothetical protein